MSPLFHIKKQVVEKRVGRHHQFVLHTNMRVINQLLMLTKKKSCIKPAYRKRRLRLNLYIQVSLSSESFCTPHFAS